MDIILYGAGKIGRSLVNTSLRNKVAYFCDANLAGTNVEGIEVISFEELKKIASNYEVVIAIKNKDYRNEISSLLDINSISYFFYEDLDESKYAGELDYWKMRFEKEGESFENQFYKRLMLAIANEESDDFWKDKIVVDFGCGPRGSLYWTNTPRVSIGVDVLMPQYLECFGRDMIRHNMFYITSDERYVPIPDKSVDYLLTINSLDHVRNLKEICDELVRILKQGGTLIASFNLFEEATECEPQSFTEEILKDNLLTYFDIISYRIGKKDENNTYKYMMEGNFIEKADGSFPCILWVRATKK